MRPLFFTVATLFAGACTAPSTSLPAECAAVPSVALVSSDRIWIRSGLRTREESVGQSTPGELYNRLSALRGSGELRGACSGASDVVAASDDTDPLQVMVVVAALKRDCERPVRVVLEASKPAVPISGLHFCGCHARRPFVYCSSPWVSVEANKIRVDRLPRLIGEACSPGAKAFISPGDVRPEAPEKATTEHTGEARVAAALASMDAPHEDMLSCRDAYLSFHGAQRWGEVRSFTADYHASQPHRITIDISPD